MATWRFPRAEDKPIGIWGEWLSGPEAALDAIVNSRKALGLARFATIQSMLSAQRSPQSTESDEEQYARALKQVGCPSYDCKDVARMMVLMDRGSARSVTEAARVVEPDVPKEGRKNAAPESIQKRLERRYGRVADEARNLSSLRSLPISPK
jgi:hypothetical protein